MFNFSKIAPKLIGVAILIFIIALIVALPMMWCWNYIMPEIFGLPEIHFGQALVINLFSAMLFNGNSSSK